MVRLGVVHVNPSMAEWALRPTLCHRARLPVRWREMANLGAQGWTLTEVLAYSLATGGVQICR